MKNKLVHSFFIMLMLAPIVIVSQDLPDEVAEAIKQTTEKCKGEIDKAFRSYLEGCPTDRSQFNTDYEKYINGHAIFKMDKQLKKMNDVCAQRGLSVEHVGTIKKDILSDLDHYYYDMVKDYLKEVVSDDALWPDNHWPAGDKHIQRGHDWAHHFCNYGFWDGAPHGIQNLNSSIRCNNQWNGISKFIKDTMEHKSFEVENNSAYSDEQRKALSDRWKKRAKFYRG